MAKIGAIAVVIIAGFISLIFYNEYRAQQRLEERRQVDVKQQITRSLDATIADTAPTLPARINSYVVFEAIERNGMELISRFTIELDSGAFARSGRTKGEWQADLYQIAVDQTCRVGSMRAFMDHGASVVYMYEDIKGNPLFSVSLTDKDC